MSLRARILFILSLVTFALPLSASSVERDAASLVIEPLVDPRTGKFTAVSVQFRFQGEPDRTTEIALPDSWGGEDRLHRFIDSLTIKGGRLRSSSDPARKTITHEAGAQLTLSYQIRARNHDRRRADQRINDYQPIVTADYVHLLGPTWLVLPVRVREGARVAVELKQASNGLRLAGDLEHLAPDGTLGLEDVRQSILVGGDFRIINPGNGLRIAVWGNQTIRTDAQWVAALDRIGRAARSYWDVSRAPYFVSIMGYPARPNGFSLGGTGLGDSFAFFTTANAEPAQIDEVMMHEILHTWVPLALGSLDPDVEPESLGYWFSEGFTDFIKMRLMVRAGIWTTGDFVQNLNESTEELARSSLVNAPNAKTAGLFWTDAEGQRLPYLRGMLFAQLIDIELRKRPGDPSLDDVLQEMKRQVDRGDQRHAIELLEDLVRGYGVAIDSLRRRHIDQGAPITLPDNGFAPCGRFEDRDVMRWNLGFDAASLEREDRIVRRVERRGPAWNAGLRSGMRAVAFSFFTDDPNSLVSITVLNEDGSQRLIQYLPASPTGKRHQFLSLSPGAAQNSACRSRISG